MLIYAVDISGIDGFREIFSVAGLRVREIAAAAAAIYGPH